MSSISHLKVPASSTQNSNNLSYLNSDLVGLAEELEKAVIACKKYEIIQFSQKLIQSGRQLVIAHVSKGATYDALPMMICLIRSLGNEKLQWDDQSKYYILKAARLFTELSWIQGNSEKRSLRKNTFKELSEILKTLSKESARGDQQVAFHFELACCVEALKALQEFDSEEILNQVFSALLNPRITSVIDLCKKIPALVEKKSKSWFVTALIANWVGITARENPKEFDEFFKLIQPESDEIKMVQLAVEFCGDIVHNGSADLQKRALTGEHGLIALLNRQKPSISFRNKVPHMWPVRYRAVQVLATLMDHPDVNLQKSALAALVERESKEKNEKVQELIASIRTRPHLIIKWKQQFKLLEVNLNAAIIKKEEEILKEIPSSKEEITVDETAYLKELQDEIETQKNHLLEMERLYSKNLKEVQEQVDLLRPKNDPDCPKNFICPLSASLMLDPVTTVDGITYERQSIVGWLKDHSNIPFTTTPLPSKALQPNPSLLASIKTYRDNYFRLAEDMLIGRAGTIQDVETAITRIFISSSQGHPIAQFYHGIICDEDRKSENDQGLRKNLEILSAHGASWAKGALVLLDATDLDLYANNTEAFKMYKKSADQNSAPGLLFLSFCYQFGKSVSQSDSDAKHWLSKAASESPIIRVSSAQIAGRTIKQTPENRLEACLYGDLDYLKERKDLYLKISPGSLYFRETNELGETPLHLAVNGGHTKVVKYILNYWIDIHAGGTDKNLNDGDQPIHYAAARGNLEIVKLLVEHGANIHTPGHEKRTPLHRAAYNNCPAVVEYLLSQGADPNLQTSDDDGKKTPLHDAVYRGYTSIVRLLASFDKTDLNLETKRGETPLMLAIQQGNIEAAILITQGTHWKPSSVPTNKNHISQLSKIKPPKNILVFQQYLNKICNPQT